MDTVPASLFLRDSGILNSATARTFASVALGASTVPSFSTFALVISIRHIAIIPSPAAVTMARKKKRNATVCRLHDPLAETYFGTQKVDDLVQHFTGSVIVLRVKRGTQAIAKVLGNAMVTQGLVGLVL
jgi:hypothetical protein